MNVQPTHSPLPHSVCLFSSNKVASLFFSPTNTFRYTCAQGLWETVMVVLFIYTVLPLRTGLAVGLGVSLPLLQTLCAAFLPDLFTQHRWLQVPPIPHE